MRIEDTANVISKESDVFACFAIWYKCKVRVLPLENMCERIFFGIMYPIPIVYIKIADSPKIFPI